MEGILTFSRKLLHFIFWKKNVFSKKKKLLHYVITTEKFFAGIPMEPASPHPTVFVDLSPVPDSDSEIDLMDSARPDLIKVTSVKEHKTYNLLTWALITNERNDANNVRERDM